MNTPAENIIEEPIENINEAASNDSAESQEEVDSKASSEFALKLVNAVKSLNNDEITHYFLETKNCGSRGEVNITNISLYDCQIIPLFD